MSLRLTLHTAGPMPPLSALQEWLTERGEAYERDGDRVRLLALPVVVEALDEATFSVVLSIAGGTPLVRLVDLVFELSLVTGSDVSERERRMSRSELWLRVADEQDRLRIASAMKLAEDRGNLDDVARRVWAILNALRPGRDVRWSSQDESIVWVSEDGTTREAVDPSDRMHLVIFRWLSEAHPSLLELS